MKLISQDLTPKCGEGRPLSGVKSYPQAEPFHATSAAVSNTRGIRFFVIP
jgi:hypothetical protein